MPSQTPAEALAALMQVHDNQMALADPQGMLWNAQVNVLKAIVSALSASPVVSPDISSVWTPSATDVTTMVQEAVAAALPAIEQQMAAKLATLLSGASTQSDAATHAATAVVETPPADAAPSSTEPVAPTAIAPTVPPAMPGV